MKTPAQQFINYFNSLNHEVKIIFTSSIAMYFANIKYDDLIRRKSKIMPT